MVKFGIIGIGPVWESRYFPVVRTMEKRVKISAVYDPVFARAQQMATELNATPVEAISSLVRSCQVDALLLIDPGWLGPQLIKFLCNQSKPVYLVGGLGNDVSQLEQLVQLTDQTGCTLVPEFSRRFTPATCRLQELLATKLGRPQRIRISASPPPVPPQSPPVPGQNHLFDFLVGLVDWSWHLIRTSPFQVESQLVPPDSGKPRQIIKVKFRKPKSRPSGARLEIAVDDALNPDNDYSQFQLTQTVICDHGDAVLTSPMDILWKVEGDREVHSESLASERSDVQVMLDHFCRRVVGGLVSVANLHDVWRSIKLVQSVEESLQSAQPIHLNGSMH